MLLAGVNVPAANVHVPPIFILKPAVVRVPEVSVKLPSISNALANVITLPVDANSKLKIFLEASTFINEFAFVALVLIVPPEIVPRVVPAAIFIVLLAPPESKFLMSIVPPVRVYVPPEKFNCVPVVEAVEIFIVPSLQSNVPVSYTHLTLPTN